MNQQQIDWSLPQRQSTAALFVIIARVFIDILKVLWPIILLTIFRQKSSRGEFWEIVLIAVPAFMLLRALIEFLFFRFNILNGELIINKGFFTKKTIVLPVGKIQAVHIEQTWLHKLFNAAQVSFDSSGSEKIEVKISAISIQKANELRSFVLSGNASFAEPQKEIVQEPIISLSPKDLFKLSISANHLEAFFLLLAFIFSMVDNLKQVTGVDESGFVSSVAEYAQSRTGAILLAMLITIMIISVIISTIRVYLKYANFSITKSEKGFRINSGLLHVKEKLVPFKKVQLISWKANLIRKWMKLYLLNFHSAGSDEMKARQEIKVPVTREEFIPVLLGFYHPILHTEGYNPVRVHQSYVFRRIFLAGVIPAIIFSAILYPVWGFNSLWFMLLIPLRALNSTLFQKKFRCFLSGTALQVSRGIYGVEMLVLKWSNIQTVTITQSWFQHARNLATLRIYTAGGIVVLPFIPYDEALQISNFALYKMEAGTESWM